MESNQKASGDGLTGTQKEAALRALVQRTGYLLQQVSPGAPLLSDITVVKSISRESRSSFLAEEPLRPTAWFQQQGILLCDLNRDSSNH